MPWDGDDAPARARIVRLPSPERTSGYVSQLFLIGGLIAGSVAVVRPNPREQHIESGSRATILGLVRNPTAQGGPARYFSRSLQFVCSEESSPGVQRC